jgi:predicted aspartyl protease
MAFDYDASYTPSFPQLPVIMSLPENSARSSVLRGLVDTGADATLAPLDQLEGIEAEEIYQARLRGYWGQVRSVSVYLVDLQVAGFNLPGIEVIGDDSAKDVLLGRNVLNRLILLLDGPAGRSDILQNAPRHR